MSVNTLRYRAAAIVSLAAFCSSGFAATTGYWRHEEGPAGAQIAPGADTVLDSSGNANHMRTFDPTFTSATYSTSVSPLALRSGLPNTLSLDFGPGGDDAGLNDDNYNDAKPIGPKLFNAMTVELAFNMDAIGGFQALLGKDGKPLADSPVPPFKMMIRGDDFPGAVPNQLFVEWIDGNGQIHNVASHATITTGAWNHVAFVLTANSAELWVAGETTPYTLLDSLAGSFAAPGGEVMIPEPLGFSVGRGMFNNGVTDWSDAKIDEVRISDSALAPDQFLFVAVPEPTSLTLIVPSVFLAARRRRIK